MTSERVALVRRLDAVEREYDVTRVAVDRLLADIRRDPTAVGLPARVVTETAARLSGTAVVILFAAFEAGVRGFWGTVAGKNPQCRARDLLDGVAARRSVPPATLAAAHAVREYRNALIHGSDTPPTAVDVSTARRPLGRYSPRLPPTW